MCGPSQTLLLCKSSLGVDEWEAVLDSVIGNALHMGGDYRMHGGTVETEFIIIFASQSTEWILELCMYK